MAVLAVLAMAAAGCGQDAESSPSASEPATPTSAASAAASASASAPAAVDIDTSTNEKPVDGSDAAAVKTVDVKARPAAQAPASASGYYKLKTVFRGEDECLEGNRVDGNSTLAGAAFQNTCKDVDGQAWSFTKRPDGYYTLRTKFLGEESAWKATRSMGRSSAAPHSSTPAARSPDNSGSWSNPVTTSSGYRRSSGRRKANAWKVTGSHRRPC
ncbi:RICIN domain-containing protein [Micromonospora profundi]|uniref:RICIN domain-containing protein n=1 Tax=Micromonospora TaxID=1873 RepID=UPI0033A141E0